MLTYNTNSETGPVCGGRAPMIRRLTILLLIVGCDLIQEEDTCSLLVYSGRLFVFISKFYNQH